ncbi:hypothetical protein CYMTET_56272 [Cymbomonas tetramitiformis]|uniref:Thioredoxin domain-containing protein n=1 Tax=Cymbomonas tetramitiformis TaxID=36881 RepID=A0AAE0BB98_9CHLO|nr:hypothetical protein CYMTET_56272 [Cymbomonas tetramitiformis]
MRFVVKAFQSNVPEIAGNVQTVKHQGDYDEFIRKAAEDKRLVLVDFYANWCPPCKKLAPGYAKLSEEFLEPLFLKVDVDQSKDVSKSCGIKCMPTVLAYSDGKVVEKLEGATLNKIQDVITNLPTTPSGIRLFMQHDDEDTDWAAFRVSPAYIPGKKTN